jgi:hypothetical protein
MKKNKKFQKQQLEEEGYTDIGKCSRERYVCVTWRLNTVTRRDCA